MLRSTLEIHYYYIGNTDTLSWNKTVGVAVYDKMYLKKEAGHEESIRY